MVELHVRNPLPDRGADVQPLFPDAGKRQFGVEGEGKMVAEILLTAMGAALLLIAAAAPGLTTAERCQLALVGTVTIVNTLCGGVPMVVGVMALRAKVAER
ncbi:hypothetical protein [Actinomadura rubrisoli]|uniref:Uncharacterized protein n=1 Tax=Actinomadura rubrisoli TaxID=2530368 RepID=A0A4R5BG24_9ACTN|nr:hypothetical protein [Actinomadura rubrisoli]TDD82632.1 hypothetical protein E1298_22460 [Actinomadura rubrisoli]